MQVATLKQLARAIEYRGKKPTLSILIRFEYEDQEGYSKPYVYKGDEVTVQDFYEAVDTRNNGGWGGNGQIELWVNKAALVMVDNGQTQISEAFALYQKEEGL